MPRKPNTLNEDIVDSGGNSVPEPVETGDTHANRPQDNLQGDQAIAHDGAQDISRAAILSALLAKLVGMDGAALQQVATAMSLTVDVVADPLAGTALAGAQASNLKSITTKEDIAELFAGEALTEDFQKKAEVIFEAAVQARAILIEAEAEERIAKLNEETEAKIAEIKEQAEKDVEAAVAGTAEELVEQIDKYITFVAEDFVEKNKLVIESTARSVLAEEALTQVATILNRYVTVSESIDPLAEAAAKIEKLEADLKEALDERIANREAVKNYRRKEIIAEAAGSLTAMQRGRLEQLCEGLDFDSESEFASKVATIKTSITRKDEAATKVSVITESVADGVAPLADDQSASSAVNIDDGVKSVLSFLQRTSV